MDKRSMLGDNRNSGNLDGQQQESEIVVSGEGMQDFLMDDLCGIFDDNSGGVDLSTFDNGESLSFDPTASAALPQQEELPPSNPPRGRSDNANKKIDSNRAKTTGEDKSKPSSSANKGKKAEPSATEKTKGKRRRASIKIVDRGLPPPSWHSELADKQHRQSMVLEIARLLQARKKSQPSSEWMHQLPHKARKLEERLYRTAPSLESYLDRTTLKNRLRRLATVITRQYSEAKLHKRLSGRSSVSSRSSFSSYGSLMSRDSMRDSISSVQSLDSLRSLQDSLTQKASFAGNNGARRMSANSTGGSTGNDYSLVTGSLGTLPESSVAPPSIIIPRSTSAGAAAPSSSSTSSVPPSSNSSVSGRGDANNAMQSSTSQGICELERQKAVNEKLQQQIMENIRQQEELVRKLQARSQANGQQQQQQQQQQPKPVSQQPSPSASHVNLGQTMQQQLSSGSLNAAQSQSLASQTSTGIPQQNAILNMNSLLPGQAGLSSTNPLVMAQGALLNHHGRFLPNNMQGQLQHAAAAASFNPAAAANLMMNNPNLLRQTLQQQQMSAQQQQQQQQQQGLTAEQMRFLANAAASGQAANLVRAVSGGTSNSNNNNNASSIISSLQQQAVPMVGGGAASAASSSSLGPRSTSDASTSSNTNTTTTAMHNNPTMQPPPPRMMQRPPQQGGGGGSNIAHHPGGPSQDAKDSPLSPGSFKW